MEREQEIAKLINVLHRIARAASFSSWIRTETDAVRFCVTQYNRVLARLKELEPAIAELFGQLADDTTPEVLRMAAQDLSAYFEDEIPVRRPHRRHSAFGHCGTRRAAVFASPTWGRCS